MYLNLWEAGVAPACPSTSLPSSQTKHLYQYQGHKRHIFLRGHSNFSWFFQGVKCFLPEENSHFGRPKTNCSGFEKWKAKKEVRSLGGTLPPAPACYVTDQYMKIHEWTPNLVVQHAPQEIKLRSWVKLTHWPR